MTIKKLEEFNLKLLKAKELFYLPDWEFLLINERINYQNSNNYDEIEGKIYDYLRSIDYVVEQKIKYEQIDIFNDLLKVYDSAIICFYQQNYLCAYFTLVPLVEGLCRKWARKEKVEETSFSVKNFIKLQLDMVKNKYHNDESHIKEWVDMHCKIFLLILKELFFSKTDNLTNENTFFNRHIIAHLLKNPNYSEAKRNTLQLLALIELMIDCYLFKYPISQDVEWVKTQHGEHTRYKYELTNCNRKQVLTNIYKICSKESTNTRFFLNLLYEKGY